MDQDELRSLLNKISSGEVSVDEAMLSMKTAPFTDLGYAKVDNHRGMRQGFGEVIYAESKTAEQIYGICAKMLENGTKPVLITRISKDKAEFVTEKIKNDETPIFYDEISRCMIVGEKKKADGLGSIVVATGGTSDMYVAEEAALTAETMGNDVIRLYDVGVAGVHRLFAQMDYIMNAKVIIAVAGMEGALASVVGGLADCPVIAVPTSVGYGASFHGLSALLSMLNSCASGVSVVNIDNGFGAGYLASMINHMH